MCVCVHAFLSVCLLVNVHVYVLWSVAVRRRDPLELVFTGVFEILNVGRYWNLNSGPHD